MLAAHLTAVAVREPPAQEVVAAVEELVLLELQIVAAEAAGMSVRLVAVAPAESLSDILTLLI